MVPTNCCYQTDPSYRKVCRYPHTLKNHQYCNVGNCAGTSAFTRPAKPYNAIASPVEPMNMLSNRCQNIDSSYRKVCSYPRIREVSKAIIMLFRMVLWQCFYVLEPLCWCLYKEKMRQYPHPPPIHEAGKAIISPFTRPAKPSY